MIAEDTANLLPAVLSVHQTRMADRFTIEGGVSSLALLTNAGTAVFNAISADIKPEDEVLVVCGSGNNGGDGLVLAGLLMDEGVEVTLALIGNKDAIAGDAREALDALSMEVASIDDVDVRQFHLIVDAVLGAGLNRPVVGKLADLFQAINASGAKVVSIDIPSGVNGDTGEINGSAIRAHRTITFFLKKPGHLLFPGRALCGDISVVQIGIAATVLDRIRPSIFENTPSLWLHALPLPSWHSHKYTRGYSVVLSGGIETCGAARLAAHAALRTGSGLVSVATPSDVATAMAAQLSAEMLRLVDSPAAFAALLEDGRINAVVVGPGLGLGQLPREYVKVALDKAPSVVLDADALSSFESDPQLLFEWIAAADCQVVLTPHHGEFNRLFGALEPEIKQPDSAAKTSIASRAAQLSRCIVVYKGPDTVIASASGDTVINSNAPPWLATAGSGDVLAGTICGWMAQGLDAFEAACAAVWLHGRAATEAGPGMIATDIAEHYPVILQACYSQTDANS